MPGLNLFLFPGALSTGIHKPSRQRILHPYHDTEEDKQYLGKLEKRRNGPTCQSSDTILEKKTEKISNDKKADGPEKTGNHRPEETEK
jgi:hypothetical protein